MDEAELGSTAPVANCRPRSAWHALFGLSHPVTTPALSKTPPVTASRRDAWALAAHVGPTRRRILAA